MSEYHSYYAATANAAPPTPRLVGEDKADVAIVGGGLTGLGAAHALAQTGVRVALLEAASLGSGASGRNGGQAHVGQRRDQIWLERVMGPDDARKLWDLALDARSHLETLIEIAKIDCAYTNGHLHLDHKQNFVPETRAYVDYLRDKYDYQSIRFVDRDEARSLVTHDRYYGGSLDLRGGHLHPLNLTLGLAHAADRAGAKLYTNSEVTGLARSGSQWRLSTPNGQMLADQVILAGDGMLSGLSKKLDTRVMPINNFIAVTAPLGAARAEALIRNRYAVSDSRFVVYYFRMTPDHRLLFGGGENYSYRFPRDIAAFVRPHIARVFPQLREVQIDYAWGGTLGITANRMPYVREVEPGLFTAAGYSGLGVVLAPYFGKILAQAVGGNRVQSGFDTLAKIPNMRFPGGSLLRWPTLVAAMSLFALRDRL